MNKYRFAPNDVLIDRYEILGFHAAGGMQEVYLAHDRALDRKVVVKTPKLDIQDKRFRRGAEMGARVFHPNVAATFDYYEDDNLTFMVEEFIDGQDLGKRLASDFVFLDPALAAHVIQHLTKAIYEAHRVGICHRDLKPSNIMTSSDFSLKQIKLTDFGISKLAESAIGVEMERFGQDALTLTQSNTLLGAVPYMAPECWSNWKGAGQPMDIWALGCISYQLITGELPFGSGRNAIVNIFQVEQTKQVNLVKPTWFGKHINTAKLENELWEIITSCLVVDPNSRPSAKDILLKCNALSYQAEDRKVGTVTRYRVPYASGGTASTGTIQELGNTGGRFFFHVSEFYGNVLPSVGQRVCHNVYPGHPLLRATPVLLLK